MSFPPPKMPEGPFDSVEKAREFATYCHAASYHEQTLEQGAATAWMLTGMAMAIIYELANKLEQANARTL